MGLELASGITSDQLNALLGAVDNADAQAVTALLNKAVVMARDQMFNGVSWDRARTPAVWKRVNAVAVVAATGATIWTPTAGKKFRLMGWLLSSSVAAQLIFGDNAVATIIAASELTAAAGVTKAGSESLGVGMLSAAANNVLKLDVTTNSTISGMVWGTEE